eukprot:scaffold22767_cov61-Phaeocystis_antarctica.AAC.1
MPFADPVRSAVVKAAHPYRRGRRLSGNCSFHRFRGNHVQRLCGGLSDSVVVGCRRGLARRELADVHVHSVRAVVRSIRAGEGGGVRHVHHVGERTAACVEATRGRVGAVDNDGFRATLRHHGVSTRHRKVDAAARDHRGRLRGSIGVPNPVVARAVEGLNVGEGGRADVLELHLDRENGRGGACQFPHALDLQVPALSRLSRGHGASAVAVQAAVVNVAGAAERFLRHGSSGSGLHGKVKSVRRVGHLGPAHCRGVVEGLLDRASIVPAHLLDELTIGGAGRAEMVGLEGTRTRPIAGSRLGGDRSEERGEHEHSGGHDLWRGALQKTAFFGADRGYRKNAFRTCFTSPPHSPPHR